MVFRICPAGLRNATGGIFLFRVYQGFYLGDIPMGPGKSLRYPEDRGPLASVPFCSPPGLLLSSVGFLFLGPVLLPLGP